MTYTYQKYEEQRKIALRNARKAGIPNPGRRWRKLSPGRLENSGEPADYWDQLASMEEATRLAAGWLRTNPRFRK